MTTPTCMLPDFAQSTPRDPDELELIEGDNRTGSLRYRDPDTGETCTVPNDATNQRSEVRLGTARYYLDVQERNLARLRHAYPPAPEYSIRDAEKQIARSKRAILSLERKIEVRDGKRPFSALLFTREVVAEHIARHWHAPLRRLARCQTTWIEDELLSEFYHLIRVRLTDISGYDAEVADLERASHYAALTTPAPAIVLATEAERADGEVLVDGYHRLRAAFERGDRDILAFVPVEG